MRVRIRAHATTTMHTNKLIRFNKYRKHQICSFEHAIEERGREHLSVGALRADSEPIQMNHIRLNILSKPQLTHNQRRECSPLMDDPNTDNYYRLNSFDFKTSTAH